MLIFSPLLILHSNLDATVKAVMQPWYGQSIIVGLETYFQVAVYTFKDWEHHKPLTNF